jgi:hypothetical protein
MQCKKEEEALAKCKLQSRIPDLQSKLDVCRATKMYPACKNIVSEYMRCYGSFQGTGMYKGQHTDCVDPYLVAVRKCLAEQESS